MIQQFRELNLPLRHGSSVLFLRDPFEGWHMYFIANLWYDDPSLKFYLQHKSHLPEAKIATMHYVFDWKDDRLMPVKLISQ